MSEKLNLIFTKQTKTNKNDLSFLFHQHSSQLTAKLKDLEINTNLCDWIEDFLTVGGENQRPYPNSNAFSAFSRIPWSLTTLLASTALTLISSLLMTLHSWASSQTEMRQPTEIRTLSEWCNDSNLCLNISKTKVTIIDHARLQGDSHTPLSITWAAIERLRSVRLTDDLTWSPHTKRVVKSACQRLDFLQRLRRFRPPSILPNFYNSDLLNCLMRLEVQTPPLPSYCWRALEEGP